MMCRRIGRALVHAATKPQPSIDVPRPLGRVRRVWCLGVIGVLFSSAWAIERWRWRRRQAPETLWLRSGEAWLDPGRF